MFDDSFTLGVIFLLLLLLFGSLIIPLPKSGEISGMKYTQWKAVLGNDVPRRLKLTQPDGTILHMFNENCSMEILDHESEWFKISKANASITYTRDSIEKQNWHDEFMSKEEAGKFATMTFRDWCTKIATESFKQE